MAPVNYLYLWHHACDVHISAKHFHTFFQRVQHFDQLRQVQLRHVHSSRGRAGSVQSLADQVQEWHRELHHQFVGGLRLRDPVLSPARNADDESGRVFGPGHREPFVLRRGPRQVEQPAKAGREFTVSVAGESQFDGEFSLK